MGRVEFIWKFCMVATYACVLGWVVGLFLMLQVPTREWNFAYIFVPLLLGIAFNVASWTAKAYLPEGEAPTKDK